MGKKNIFHMLKIKINKERIPLSNLIIIHHPATGGFMSVISEEDYKKDTSELVNLAEEVTALAKEADGRENKINYLRIEINNWVAKYRREPNFAGRPSYSNMYSVVNALSGHFNNFGTSAPIPKKRLDRIIQELDQCSLLLSKNR